MIHISFYQMVKTEQEMQIFFLSSKETGSLPSQHAELLSQDKPCY